MYRRHLVHRMAGGPFYRMNGPGESVEEYAIRAAKEREYKRLALLLADRQRENASLTGQRTFKYCVTCGVQMTRGGLSFLAWVARRRCDRCLAEHRPYPVSCRHCLFCGDPFTPTPKPKGGNRVKCAACMANDAVLRDADTCTVSAA